MRLLIYICPDRSRQETDLHFPENFLTFKDINHKTESV